MQKHRAAHRAYPENRFVPIKLIHIYPEPLYSWRMIETAAITVVAAVFFGTVLLPAMARLSFDAPRRTAPQNPVPSRARPSPRDIRITHGNRLRPEIPQAIVEAEQKVESKLARRVARLIAHYPERSLIVIRRWLHESPA